MSSEGDDKDARHLKGAVLRGTIEGRMDNDGRWIDVVLVSWVLRSLVKSFFLLCRAPSAWVARQAFLVESPRAAQLGIDRGGLDALSRQQTRQRVQGSHLEAARRDCWGLRNWNYIVFTEGLFGDPPGTKTCMSLSRHNACF